MAHSGVSGEPQGTSAGCVASRVPRWAVLSGLLLQAEGSCVAARPLANVAAGLG